MADLDHRDTGPCRLRLSDVAAPRVGAREASCVYPSLAPTQPGKDPVPPLRHPCAGANPVDLYQRGLGPTLSRAARTTSERVFLAMHNRRYYVYLQSETVMIEKVPADQTHSSPSKASWAPAARVGLPPIIMPGPRSGASYIVTLVAPTGDHENTSCPQIVCTGSGGTSA